MGLDRNRIERRLRQGRLHPVHRGVYAVGHSRLGERGRWFAALLACGPAAALSHRTAAALWDLRRSEGATVEVSVATQAGRERRDGLVVHRVRLDSSETTNHEDVRVTTPARTLLDLAAVLPKRDLARAVEAAERARLFDLGAIDELLRRYPRRPGTPALERAVEAHRPELELTRSELEWRFLDLCRAHRVPAPLVNVPIGTYVVDFLWPHAKLVVETDGAETHSTRAAFERDRERDAELTVAGYRVVRFTCRRLVAQPQAVAQALRVLLA